MDKFKDLINENIADIFDIKPKSYYDLVKDNIVEYICEKNQISEKAFDRIDETIKHVNSFFEDFDNHLRKFITKCESENKRVNYCSEIIIDRLNNEIWGDK